MSKGAKIALYIGGGVLAAGVVVVGVAMIIGPREQGPGGGGNVSSIGATLSRLGLGAGGNAQAVRDAESSGGSGRTAQTDDVVDTGA